jgi:translation elongation factor EF-1beta
MKIDGVAWSKRWQLQPLAYGINKLMLGCLLAEDKVSFDDVAEKITQLGEKVVQSVDITSSTNL